VLDTEAKSEGGILEGGNACLVFCMVEPGKSLPEMPCRVEETSALDNLFWRAIRYILERAWRLT
jgi:hypothetical protein